jgi:cell division transport system permease protein
MRLRLVVAEAWRSLGANVSTTVAATMTVLVGMFLLGVFVAFGTYVVSWSDHVKRELIVKVAFTTKPQATRAQEAAVVNKLKANPNVKENGVVFVPKEKALKIMEKRYPEMTGGLAWNPLPDALEVTPTKAEHIEAVAASLRPLPAGVHSVQTGKNLSSRVLQVAHWIEAIFIIATGVLLVASTLLISNTIRLSIFSRRREIEVMKLVGATNWFIRGPFMIEGLLCGLGGAALAIFFLILGKEIALPAIHLESALASEPDVKALAFPLTALILLGVGVVLGAIGSGLTIRRFLRV